MLPVLFGKRQQTKEHCKGLVNRSDIGQRRLFRHILRFLFRCSRIIVRSKLAILQCLADFPVGFRIADVIDSCIQAQHAAMFSAVITTPGIQLCGKTHFPAFISADRAVRIVAGSIWTSYPQMQQLRHIHNAEWEIVRFPHSNPSFHF